MLIEEIVDIEALDRNLMHNSVYGNEYGDSWTFTVNNYIVVYIHAYKHISITSLEYESVSMNLCFMIMTSINIDITSLTISLYI